MPSNSNEPTDLDLKSIIGEIPNYIFEYLELSEDIKKEWKYGNKASDFGGHNQFVQKFTSQLEALILDRERQTKIDTLIQVDPYIDYEFRKQYERDLEALQQPNESSKLNINEGESDEQNQNSNS